MKLIATLGQIVLITALPMLTQAGGDPDELPQPEASVNEKPYRIVDGNIDADTIEGWKTYRGAGGCNACHGPAGEGGVGKNLLVSLQERLDEQQFKWIVTEGRSGTQMKAFKYNQKVMDNLDNLYAYIKARSDGVLGPDNLLKYPFGKKPPE